MYPEQQQPNQPQQYSIDYLNQIAPQPKKPGLNRRLFLVIIGGGLVLVLIVGVLTLFSSGSNGPTQKMETLAARLKTLQTISDNAQPNIKSNSLRSTNSTLDILLTNANRDIITPLSKNNIDIKNIDKSITATENGSALSQKLSDAKLNAVFDRTYASEMNYQLNTVLVLMQDIYTRVNSKSMKDFINTTTTNLQPIEKQFDNFNAATS